MLTSALSTGKLPLGGLPRNCVVNITDRARYYDLKCVIIRDYRIGILVIACRISPRPHYQAREH